MQLALDIASTAIILTLFFGVGLLFLAAWYYVTYHRFGIRHPAVRTLPTRAVDSANAVLERLQARQRTLPAAERVRLGHDIHWLELRLRHLQRKTNDEQRLYYELVRRRQREWLHGKELFDRLQSFDRRARREAREEIQRIKRRLHELDRMVQDEWHRAVAHDDMNLEELRGQGVLELDRRPAGYTAFPDEEAPPPRAATSEAPAGADTAAAGAGEAGQAAASPAGATEAEAEPAEGEPAGSEGKAAPVDEGATAPAGEAGAGAEPAPEAEAEAGREPFAVHTTGAMHQEDFQFPGYPLAHRRYADPVFDMRQVPRQRLVGKDLSGASFRGVRLLGVHRYRDCRFRGADLRDVHLARGEHPHAFVGCDLSGASLAGSVLEYVVFVRCDLIDTRWEGARLNLVKFEDCAAEGAAWEGVDLSRTHMSPAMWARTDLSAAARPPHNYAPEAASAGDEPAPEAAGPAAETPAEEAAGPDAETPAPLPGEPAAPERAPADRASGESP